MKKIIAIFGVLFANSAIAAGTYMGTGGYTSPQQKYYTGNSGGTGGYYQPQYRGTSGYPSVTNYSNYQQGYQNYQAQPQTAVKSSPSDKGFYIGGGLSHQYADWNFSMKSAGSVLSYDNIAWNVLDVKGGYNYGDYVIDGGISYGMQSGTGKMIDDDITAGGLETPLYDSTTGAYVGSTFQKVLSVGESSGGNLFGFNIGAGLKNKFGFGKVKLVPSVGYRIFDYKLTTNKNNGLSVANSWCGDAGNGQIHCPAFIWYDDGTAITGEPDSYDGYYWWHTTSAGDISNGDTYSFSQAGDTHIYNVSWSGPYVAVDFTSVIDPNNSVGGRIEVGFPGYQADGDQPYRADWEHPKSVEDTKPMFGAIHLGMLANWTTNLTKNWDISFGVTYDYYDVSGADAITHLNGDYYTGILQTIFDNGVTNGDWTDDDAGLDVMYSTNPTAITIAQMYASCGNSWTCKTKSEVDSAYKSLGVRLGLVGKF